MATTLSGTKPAQMKSSHVKGAEKENAGCRTSYRTVVCEKIPELMVPKGRPASHLKLDRNSNVSHMGWMRHRFIYPDGVPASGLVNLEMDKHKLDVPECYFANHHQVSEWAKAVGMPQYAPLFLYHRINGRKLMTLDAVALERLGMKDTASNLQMESKIRDVCEHARRLAAEYDVLPYFFTQYLNLGLAPPRPYHRELCQFTDPWRNETGKFINTTANDLFPRIIYPDLPDPPEMYEDTRLQFHSLI